jgi:tetratricopeptide (TPR) repeat protein
MTLSDASPLHAAVAGHKEGRLAEAEAVYRAVLLKDPADPDAANLLGVLCQQTGRLAESRHLLEDLISRYPRMETAFNNLGITLQALCDRHGALAAYTRAVALSPTYVEARHNIALLATEQSDFARAEAELVEALRYAPRMPELYLALGNVYLGCGRYDSALTLYQNLLDLDPSHVIGHNNIGMVFSRLGLPAPAIARFDRALSLDPTYAEARWNRARQRLTSGDWARGWQDFEARLETPKFAYTLYRPGVVSGTPVWRGEPIEGRTLLLHAEQGRGDSIQFIRWARCCADRGATVILDVEADLVRLFESHDPRITVVARGPQPPPHDFSCPLPSLPSIFQATEATVPAAPYLFADPDRVKDWADRLLSLRGEASPDALKIGLIWAGNPEFAEDQSRSPRLPAFLPLLTLPGIRFFGLQVGHGRRDLEETPLPDSFTDLGSLVTDFAETAAAMANMDLIISSCTGPAHLAGALGRPLWIALSFVPDWRWMRDRADTPWYPQARLFRQPQPGDWAGLINAMKLELKRLGPNAA